MRAVRPVAGISAAAAIGAELTARDNNAGAGPVDVLHIGRCVLVQRIILRGKGHIAGHIQTRAPAVD